MPQCSRLSKYVLGRINVIWFLALNCWAKVWHTGWINTISMKHSFMIKSHSNIWNAFVISRQYLLIKIYQIGPMSLFSIKMGMGRGFWLQTPWRNIGKDSDLLLISSMRFLISSSIRFPIKDISWPTERPLRFQFFSLSFSFCSKSKSILSLAHWQRVDG